MRRVVDAADVVLTSSRARAVEQLGLDPELSVRSGRTRVWLSISGYGSGGRDAERVAFGDDAAVAGGLVSWDDDGPMFCADAIADPATGMVASAAVLGALADGGRWLIDVSMADVAWDLAGPTIPVDDETWRDPPPRSSVGRGARAGRGHRRRAGRARRRLDQAADRSATGSGRQNPIAVVGSGMLRIGGSGRIRLRAVDPEACPVDGERRVLQRDRSCRQVERRCSDQHRRRNDQVDLGAEVERATRPARSVDSGMRSCGMRTTTLGTVKTVGSDRSGAAGTVTVAPMICHAGCLVRRCCRARRGAGSRLPAGAPGSAAAESSAART